ncbi:MAG: peptide chain release factor 3, partial [Kordiimonadaceae bacterium]|nr:peptide chain release factor 3 [Kordiimonadaceae bacterium]
MKAKHLARALHQLAEEGAARVFKPVIGAEWYVGVVGVLQFEVMADRIRTEYDVPCRFETTSLYTAQWVEADDPHKLKKFIDTNKANMAEDHNGSPVFLARNAWRLDKAIENYPDLRFLKTKEQLI